jgi:hypothetical protein
MKMSLLLAAVLVMLSGCSGFQPVSLEPDDKKQLDYREGDWQPKNS